MNFSEQNSLVLKEQVKEAGIEIKMAANAFDGQCIATLKNRHPWVEYAVHTQPKPISGCNKPNSKVK